MEQKKERRPKGRLSKAGGEGERREGLDQRRCGRNETR
jgi:hypothetical protein